MRFETKAIHAGLDVANDSQAVVPPISPSTVFEIDAGGRNEEDFHYTRLNNPNRQQLEQLIASLEKGKACAAFSSGVAAAAAVLQALDPGDHVLIPDDVYAGNRFLVQKVMLRWGLEVDFIRMTDPEIIRQNLREETRLIWIETPSNPMLRITDIRAVCQLARENDCYTCVDNTWPTPLNQLPLELGADLVLHSTTKYFGGHSDLLGGAIVAKTEDGIFERIREIQKMAGAVPSPRDCWLLSRSIRSFPYRMRGHNQNAAKLAQFLDNHPNIKEVFFPGLPMNEGHEVAKQQMSGFGGMISFLIHGDKEKAIEIVGKAKLIKRATSLGGVESTWEHRRSSEGEDSLTPQNLIRISVGLEHPEDLIEDLEQALE